MHEPSDYELMEQIKQGKQEAFTVLIRRHQDSLVNFFRQLGANNDSEDLVQDTFLRLFRYRMRYRPSAKFTTFLYTLARHTWVDRWRKNERGERLQERLKNESDEVDEGGPPIRNRIDAQEALSRLPEKLRMVLVMSLYQGLNYEEIAEALDIPLGTVKSRVFLALSRLREMFDEK
jgi:RNA polymerase sigma-70 factor (ECF subfamily)